MRTDVAFAIQQFGMSERQACKLVKLDRSSYRYEPMPDHNAQLREELVELARRSLATVTGDYTPCFSGGGKPVVRNASTACTNAKA